MNLELNEILYGMPILEDPRVALKETRLTELIEIKKILDSYKKYVLQVRVGATDFSSCFGVRRGFIIQFMRYYLLLSAYQIF